MSNFQQAVVQFGGQPFWMDDDTDLSHYPYYDKGQSLGTRNNRALLNHALAKVRIFQTSAAGAAVTNSLVETSILGTKVGPAYVGASTAGTLPANFMKRVGSSIKFHAEGVMANTVNTPTLAFAVYIGTMTPFLYTGTTATISAAPCPWFFDGELTVTTLNPAGAGTSATFLGHGNFTYFTTNLKTAVNWAFYNASPTVINTTIANALDMKVTWGEESASNTITCQYAYADVVL